MLMGCYGVLTGGYGGYEWLWVVMGSFGMVKGGNRWLCVVYWWLQVFMGWKRVVKVSF